MNWIARLLVFLSALCASPAFGAPAAKGSKTASKAIATAMDTYAKDRDADQADAALLGAVAVCGQDCSKAVLARAWMYIGLVKGSGEKDWDTAREAFSVALGFDPTVTLDPRFFTPTAQALFDGLKRQSKEEDPSQVVARFEPGTQMGCWPLVREVEAFRPIPISCSTRVSGVVRVVLRYRAYGSDRWTRSELRREGDEWLGEIPCTELSGPGTWGMYVEAKDERDDALERIGSRERPLVFEVVEESAEPPPSLPGRPAPDKCVETTYCPEDMVGTPACEALKGRSGSGEVGSCSATSDCDLGMDCVDGTCQAASICTADADCPSEGEVCRAGLCELPETAGKRDWFGVHFGADFALLGSANDVCTPGGGFACFDGADAYDGTPYRDNGGGVASGLHMGTMRVMLAYDRFLFDRFSLGVRFGFAFSGAPEDFFPLHLEGRGTYYFGDLTRGLSTFVPYVAAGFGLAQVDSRVEVQMVDCLPDQVASCQAAAQVDEGLVDPDTGAARLRTLDAYRSLGSVFGVLSPGLMIAFSRTTSIAFNVGLLLMTEEDSSASLLLSLQPSAGLTLGF